MEFQGHLHAPGARIAIVAARWNSFLVDRLVEGALDALVRSGIARDDIDVARVPGAFELALVCEKLAATARYDAIIALGAVIRGATAHFELVAGEAAKGTSAVSQRTGIPVIFGVLTTDTIEQAIERAGTKAGNKGAEAALAAIEMVDLLRKIEAAQG